MATPSSCLPSQSGSTGEFTGIYLTNPNSDRHITVCLSLLTLLCFSIDITSYAVIFAIGTLVSTWLLAFAYKNTKHLLKHKVAVKRESAVTKEMNKKLADDKKISKKEKDERILWKKNEVAEYESTTFSIFYNNALFLALVIIASFYILSVSIIIA